MRVIPRPEPGEYAPYTIEYFDLVPGDDVLAHMASCLETTVEFFEQFPELELGRPHRGGEWTILDVLQHIIDDERIYAYRALRFARHDPTELPSFDQDLVAAFANANERSLSDLLAEYRAVRSATIALFDGLPEEALRQTGIANGSRMSVRAAAHHIAGHEQHHLVSLRTNYPLRTAEIVGGFSRRRARRPSSPAR